MRKEQTYREYVTDSLYYHAKNKALGVRYSEFMKRKPPISKAKAEDIAKDIMSRLKEE